MPIWMLLAIMPLVIGGPDVAFCQLNLYWMSLYLPVFGRCFSSRPSSLSPMPPVTVFVVVCCVPMPISSVSALAWPGVNAMAAAAIRGRKPASLDAAPTLMRQILSNQTGRCDLHGSCGIPRPRRRAAGLLGAEQTDWLDGFEAANDMPSRPF